MARFLTFFIIMSLIFLVIECYAFQALKTLTRNRYIKWTWIVIAVLVYLHLFYVLLTSSRYLGQTNNIQWAIGIMLTCLIPKIVLLFFMFGEDIYRLGKKIIGTLISNETQTFEGRRAFVAKLAMGIAALPLVSFLYGIFEGKFNFKVLKYELAFKDLPEAFNGFTITQFSDVHSGSFTSIDKVQYGIDLINAQKSDIILFTGDIVNNKANEMDPWIDLFSTLNADYGKFSILGNHDYGDYIEWHNEAEKAENFETLINIHPKIGFKLLRNQNHFIQKNGEKIALIGVENWGKGFNKQGDLNKASKGIEASDFKILMSHDPTHWEYKVKSSDFNYQLTLSGHTHGLQMGIEIPGIIKWSPAKYIYKQWAGMYNEMGRYLNVNRGFGYHAFPGRVGIWPEITVITLKKA